MSRYIIPSHPCSEFNHHRPPFCHHHLHMAGSVIDTYSTDCILSYNLYLPLDIIRHPGRLCMTHLNKMWTSGCNLVSNLQYVDIAIDHHHFHRHFIPFKVFLNNHASIPAIITAILVILHQLINIMDKHHSMTPSIVRRFHYARECQILDDIQQFSPCFDFEIPGSRHSAFIKCTDHLILVGSPDSCIERNTFKTQQF